MCRRKCTTTFRHLAMAIDFSFHSMHTLWTLNDFIFTEQLVQSSCSHMERIVHAGYIIGLRFVGFCPIIMRRWRSKDIYRIPADTEALSVWENGEKSERRSSHTHSMIISGIKLLSNNVHDTRKNYDIQWQKLFDGIIVQQLKRKINKQNTEINCPPRIPD